MTKNENGRFARNAADRAKNKLVSDRIPNYQHFPLREPANDAY